MTHHRMNVSLTFIPVVCQRLLYATFDPPWLGVQRSRINIARGEEPGDEVNLCPLWFFCCCILRAHVQSFKWRNRNIHSQCTFRYIIPRISLIILTSRLSPDQSLLASAGPEDAVIMPLGAGRLGREHERPR